MKFEEMREKACKEIFDNLSEEEKERRKNLPYTVKMMAREVIPILLESFNDMTSSFVSLKFLFDKIGMNEKTSGAILNEAATHISEVFNNETFDKYNKEMLWEACERDYAENKETYEEMFEHFKNKFDEFILKEALVDYTKNEKPDKVIHIIYSNKEN